MTMDRRSFLQAAAAAGATAAVWPLTRGLTHQQALAQALPLGVAFDAAPFTLGVASGDPLPESVILWTRVAPEPLTGGGALPETVEIDWVVAADPRLRRVVARGTTPATAATGHTVHVDVGGLEPGRTYWYRFAALSGVSRIGRTRTAPVGSPASLRYAFVSCSNFHSGSFASYRGLVAEDVDFVVHLGDYLYEEFSDENDYRAEPDNFEISTVQEYRNRYALYRGDPALRAVHAAFPFIVTWDDHEFDNDYADLTPEDTEGPKQDSPEAFAERRAAAYAVYYESMPMRLGTGGTNAGPPVGPDFKIYRRFGFGDLLDLSVIDTRQYRTDQPCGGGAGNNVCSDVDDPEATLLGPEQAQWLRDQLTGRDVAWRGIANQVMVGQLKIGGLPEEVQRPIRDADFLPVTDGDYLNTDMWDGYQAERNALLGFIADRQVPDVVVITGDIHSHWVNDLKVDFDDPIDPVVATEFVGTSISSGGFPAGSNQSCGRDSRSRTRTSASSRESAAATPLSRSPRSAGARPTVSSATSATRCRRSRRWRPSTSRAVWPARSRSRDEGTAHNPWELTVGSS